MTETPQQDRSGVRTENLRDYSRLRRSTSDRKIAGVAGGLGRHLDIDPTILRVLFVVLCFFGGAGFLLYGVAWLVVPEEGTDHAVVATSPSVRTAVLIGVAVLAALALLARPWHGFWFPWPLALVALLLFLILMNRDKTVHDTSSRPPQASGPGERPTADPPEAGTTATLAPYDQPGYGADAPPPPWAPPTEEAYEPPRPRPDRGPKLFGFTVALLAVALGALGLYDTAGGHVVPAAYPALALTVVGAMLLVGAWFGRAGGLIALGLLAALALAVTTGVRNLNVVDGRQVEYRPAGASLVRSDYTLNAGQLTVDLTGVRNPASLDGRTLHVDANVGEIIVVLPPAVAANVDATVSGPGAINLPGAGRGGINTHLSQQVDAAGTEVARVNLNLDLSVGHIEVRRR